MEIVALSITREMEKINEWPHVDVVFAQPCSTRQQSGQVASALLTAFLSSKSFVSLRER